MIPPTRVDQSHFYWDIDDPVPGIWAVTVRTAQNAEGTYLVEAAVESDVTLNAFLGLPLPEREWVWIYRSRHLDGHFRLVGVSKPGRDFIDRAVLNGRRYCYRVTRKLTWRLMSAPSNVRCVVPQRDPHPPTGSLEIEGGEITVPSRAVTLHLSASDGPEAVEFFDPERPLSAQRTRISGVAAMKIWNPGGRDRARWERFSNRRPWMLEPDNGRARVFVQFRDAAGNESAIESDGALLRPVR